MTVKEEYADIFEAEIVASTVIEGLGLAVYSNDLLHVKVPKYYSIDLVVFRKAQNWLTELDASKEYHFVFEFASFSEVDPEMRKHRAKKEGTNFSLSDALVISNLPQKMLGDFYLKINRPPRPTKIFSNLNKAVDWSLKQKNKLQNP
ncbi:MAG: hypothetical protein Crog4KO_21420 [Crocinitomicaceae bacterium]